MKSTQEHQAGLLLCVSIEKGKNIQIVKFNMNAFNGESVVGENALRDANYFFLSS